MQIPNFLGYLIKGDERLRGRAFGFKGLHAAKIFGILVV